MTVREYMHTSGISEFQLMEILGYKSTSPITKRMDEELPERWVRKLEELSTTGVVAPESAVNSGPGNDNESEREPNITDEAINDWITSEGRAEDKDPNIDNVNSGTQVIGPQQIKLSTIKGYVEMIYAGGETLARARGDEIAADTIHAYTPQYVEAWMDYIRYDERILKYLEQLNLGTPIGNLVGIHAISVGAYVLARVTAKEIAANAATNGHNSESEL